MILHIFCVLVIAVSSAICAPGPEAFQDHLEEGRQNDNNRKPSDPQGNLDPIGGPNMVRIDDNDEEDQIFQSLESLDNLQEAFQDLLEESPQNENSKKPSDPQGNLDSIGGPNMVRIDDNDEEDQIFQSLETLVSLQDALVKNLEELPRYGNLTPPPDTRGTLDPIGGTSIFRIIDSDEEDEIFHSLDTSDNLQDTLFKNLEEMARYDTRSEEAIVRSLTALENQKVDEQDMME